MPKLSRPRSKCSCCIESANKRKNNKATTIEEYFTGLGPVNKNNRYTTTVYKLGGHYCPDEDFEWKSNHV